MDSYWDQPEVTSKNTVEDAFSVLAEFIAEATVKKLRGEKRERENTRHYEQSCVEYEQRLKCYRQDAEQQRMKILKLEKEVERLKKETGEIPASVPLSLEFD